jgi:plastocyanin
MIQEPDHRRLLLHAIFGASIVVLPWILAALTRFAPRSRAGTALFAIPVGILVPVQIWLGILMLFDGHGGPLTGFSSGAAPHAHATETPAPAPDAEPGGSRTRTEEGAPHESGPGQPDDREAASAAEIRITPESAADPGRLSVHVGQTVVWRNASDVPHAIAVRAGDVPEGAEPFDSGEIAPGGEFRRRLTAAGTYRYACDLHPDEGLAGLVEVREDAGTPR